MPRRRYVQDRDVNLDNFIKMSWSGNLLTFSRFLNMRPETHVIAYDKSLEYKKQVDIQESILFSRDMSGILYAVLSESDLSDVFPKMKLEQILNNSRISINIDHVFHQVIFKAQDIIHSLWVKFAFEVLALGVYDRICKCPGCLMWLAKKRTNQMFCCANCKHFFYRSGRIR
jgi:hypothetical protein